MQVIQHPAVKKKQKWEVVTKTAGLNTAEIIVGRLMAEGIPARAWQEGAGQAFGLTVGLLGNGLCSGAGELCRTGQEPSWKHLIEMDDPASEESDDEATSGME